MANRIIDCLTAKFQSGKIFKEQLDAADAEIGKLSPQDAQQRSEQLIKNYNDAVDRTAQRNLNFLQTRDRIQTQLQQHLDNNSGFGIIRQDMRYEFTNRLRDAETAALNSIVAPISSVLAKMSPSWLKSALTQKSAMYDILNAYFGVGGRTPEADIWANELKNFGEFIRNRAQAAGINKDWTDKPYVPINFNPQKLLSVDPGTFISDILQHSDRNYFMSTLANHLSTYDGDTLKYAADLLKAFKIGNMDMDMPIGSSIMRSAFQDAVRAVNPDSWFTLAGKYGDDNLFTTLMNNANGYARRFSTAENLVSLDHANALTDTIRDQLYAADKFSKSRIDNLVNDLKTDAQIHFGDLSRYAFDGNGASTFLANVIGTAKNLTYGTALPLLGPMALSRDGTLGAFARMARGMDVVGGLFKTFSDLFTTGKTAQELVKAGLMGEYYMRQISNESAFYNATTGFNWSRDYANFMTKLGGLNRILNANQEAMIQIGAAHLTENLASKDWNQLAAGDQRFLNRAGVTEDTWNYIKSRPDLLQDVGATGAKYLDLNRLLMDKDPDIRKVGQDLGVFLQNLVFAGSPIRNVHVQNFQVKAANAVGSGLAPIVNSFSTYMAHSVGIIEDHILLPTRTGAGYGMAYLAAIVPAFTVLNFLTMGINDILSGKNAPPLDSIPLWKRAAEGLPGPFAVGLFDLLSGQKQGAFGRPLDSIAQPFKALYKNGVNQFEGKPTFYQADLAKWASNEIPNTWYARALVERMIKDNFLKIVDPDAEKHFARQVANQEANGGYWWLPGNNKPTNTPTLLQSNK